MKRITLFFGLLFLAVSARAQTVNQPAGATTVINNNITITSGASVVTNMPADGTLIITNFVTGSVTDQSAAVSITGIAAKGVVTNNQSGVSLNGGTVLSTGNGGLTNFFTGPTYYVATNGADGVLSTNPNSPGLYGYAHTNAAANSIVVFMPGIYNAKFGATDASANNMAWVAQITGTAILSNGGSSASMTIGASNLISGLTFTGKRTSPGASNGLQMMGGGSKVQFCTFYPLGDSIFISEVAGNLAATTNEFIYNDFYGQLDVLNMNMGSNVFESVRNNSFHIDGGGSQTVLRILRFDSGVIGEAIGNSFSCRFITNAASHVGCIYLGSSAPIVFSSGNTFNFINSSNAYAIWIDGGTLTTGDVYPSGTFTNPGAGTVTNIIQTSGAFAVTGWQMNVNSNDVQYIQGNTTNHLYFLPGPI